MYFFTIQVQRFDTVHEVPSHCWLTKRMRHMVFDESPWKPGLFLLDPYLPFPWVESFYIELQIKEAGLLQNTQFKSSLKFHHIMVQPSNARIKVAIWLLNIFWKHDGFSFEPFWQALSMYICYKWWVLHPLNSLPLQSLWCSTVWSCLFWLCKLLHRAHLLLSLLSLPLSTFFFLPSLSPLGIFPSFSSLVSSMLKASSSSIKFHWTISSSVKFARNSSAKVSDCHALSLLNSATTFLSTEQSNAIPVQSCCYSSVPLCRFF